MAIKKHIKRHRELHRALDELIADFINETEKDIDETILTDFIKWSYGQTINIEGGSNGQSNTESS